MQVTVVVPWRGGCPHRHAAWQWIRDRYATQHPGWQLILAPAPPGPWVKARAVNPAIAVASGELIVVADADCWCDELQQAVDAVRAGAGWAIPHLHVRRLSQASTSSLIAGQPAEQLDQPPYEGVRGGGFVIAPRELLVEVPLDPRFTGWGQEDESWAFALSAIAREPWRGTAGLLHLWHPPQPRMTRTRGSMDGWQLRRRYAQARHDPTATRRLLQEARDAAHRPLDPLVHDRPPRSW